MLTLPIKEKERSENDEKDAPEIDLRISRGIKGKSANVRPEGGAFRTFKSTSPVTSVAQEQPGRQTREFLE